MKYIRLILVAAVLISVLAGCSESPASDAPTFYYLLAQPEFGSDGSIIGSESRPSAEGNNQLRYLLALYLSGPIDESLRSPVPNSTAIMDLHFEGISLHLTMNGAFSTLSSVDITKACACIALTVFDCSNAQSIVIHYTETASGVTKALEFSRDSLLLHDSLMPDP